MVLEEVACLHIKVDYIFLVFFVNVAVGKRSQLVEKSSLMLNVHKILQLPNVKSGYSADENGNKDTPQTGCQTN